MKYTPIPLGDIGGGIDSLSPLSSIPEGFSEFLENFDPTPEGSLRKRKGYQLFAGGIPVRVSSLEYTDEASDNISFYLDSSADLSQVRNSPLLVYGRTGTSHSGDWTNTNSLKWYSGFTTNTRRTVEPGATEVEVLDGSAHEGGALVSARLFQSTSALLTDNILVEADSISIDQSTADISYTITQDGADTADFFLSAISRAVTSGESYLSSATSCTGGGDTTTITITAGTHGLNSFNICAEVYEDTGSAYNLIRPDSLTVSNTGTVTCEVTNNDAAAFDAVLLLYVTPAANQLTGTAAADSSTTITLTDLSTPFPFVHCYLEQTLGGTKELVIPDSVTTDSTAMTATVTFRNESTAAANFVLLWDTGTVVSNRIQVTGEEIGTGYSDSEVQLTIWGLSHTEIYGPENNDSRPGWVTHLDVYRTEATEVPVAGLGGNLFTTQSGPNTTYGLATRYPNLRQRVGTTTTLGPVFWDLVDTPGRTAGYIQLNGGSDHTVRVSSAAYQEGTQLVRYTLECPDMELSGTLSDIITTSDEIIVSQMGWSVHNGTFTVAAVSSGTDQIFIDVSNALVSDTDYDESGSYGIGGIFTDTFSLADTSPFIPGDTLGSTEWGEEQLLTVVSSSGSNVIIRGLQTELDFPIGLRVVGSRTSSVLPLRTLTEVASVENYVRGDVLTYSEIGRQLRVKSIFAEDDTPAFIDGDGEFATVTLMGGNTSGLSTGQKLLVLDAGAFTGVVTISEVVDSSSFTFESTTEARISGTIAGNTLEVDEELSWSDSVTSSSTVCPTARWIPIEAPAPASSYIRQTYYRHLSYWGYTEQPFLRSAMSANNLYLSNGYDPVQRYDGDSLSRAGLIRWQSGLFGGFDTGASAKVEVVTASITPSAVSGAVFTVTLGEELAFLAGQRIRHSYSGGYDDYTLVRTWDDGTNGFVEVEAYASITLGTSPSLTRLASYRYYARLNLLDGNGNTVASAVTGASDLRIELAESAAVYLTLLRPPLLDNYDYARVEVEIYRTKAYLSQPYYRITTLAPAWTATDSYLHYTDTRSDDTLTDLDLVNSALLGQELGQTWSEPLRARYLTSTSSRVVLANLRDWPKIDVQMVDSGTRITTSQLSGLKWTLRKDSTDTATTTNNTDRMTFEMVTSGTVTIDPTTDVSVSSGSMVVTSTAHGLVADDWVYLFHSATGDGKRPELGGLYQITAADTDTFTVSLSTSLASYTPGADDVDRYVTATAPEDIPVWIGADGLYPFIGGNLAAGLGAQNLAARRLTNAVNAAQVGCQVDDFSPWIVCDGGSEYQYGQFILSSPLVLETTPSLTLPAYSGFDIFVQGVRRAASDEIEAQTRLFPSRLIVSYPNYPEVFDAPTAQLDFESESAIDINPSDGQEITGVIPFFGASAFGAAQKDSILLVFKTASIYVVNLAEKAAGRNAVQRLDSRGLGCTAPYSIANTQNGIMFANQSGIYRVSTSLDIQSIGRRLERSWRRVDRDVLESQTFGHYSPLSSQYVCTLPFEEDSLDYPARAFTYNTTREYSPDGYRDGSWTNYSSMPSLGWANLLDSALFASPFGEVFSIRNQEDETDYRDDGAAIEAVATLRAMDFGSSGIRKAIQAIILQFATTSNSPVNVTLESSIDLADEFLDSDQATLRRQPTVVDGLSQEGIRKVITLQFALNRRKGVYIQLRVSNSEINQDLELTSGAYLVAGLSLKGITDAHRTT